MNRRVLPKGYTMAKNDTKKSPSKAASAKAITVTIKFLPDSNGGHHHIVIEDIDDKHVSVGLTTHKRKGKGKKSGKNYTLSKSPLNDGKESYMRRQGTVKPKKSYQGAKKGKMTEKDYRQAKVYGDKAKAKYLSPKGKKK